jgi:hypothetical protein
MEGIARGVSTVVEQSTHDPKFKGSYLASAGTWGLYYKTFYGRHFQIFVIS